MGNMLEAEIWTIVRSGPSMAVLLRPLNYQISVPIFIGHLEAQSILAGFSEDIPRRSFIHDLMVRLIRHTGFEMRRVEIYDIKNSVFLARMYFQGPAGSSPLTLDARPSDAIALAMRGKCPIFVSQKIVSDVGVPEEFFFGTPEKAAPPPQEPAGSSRGNSRRMTLQTELEDAVAREDYEKAAEIRDMLILMDKPPEGGNPLDQKSTLHGT